MDQCLLVLYFAKTKQKKSAQVSVICPRSKVVVLHMGIRWLIYHFHQ